MMLKMGELVCAFKSGEDKGVVELKYVFYIKEMQNQLVKSEKSVAALWPASSKDTYPRQHWETVLI